MAGGGGLHCWRLLRRGVVGHMGAAQHQINGSPLNHEPGVDQLLLAAGLARLRPIEGEREEAGIGEQLSDYLPHNVRHDVTERYTGESGGLSLEEKHPILLLQVDGVGELDEGAT